MQYSLPCHARCAATPHTTCIAPVLQGHALADTPAATPPKPTRVRAAARPPARRTTASARPAPSSSSRLFLANLLLILTGTLLGAYIYLQQPQHAQLRAELTAYAEHAYQQAGVQYQAILGDRIDPVVHAVGEHVGPYLHAAYAHIAPTLDAVTSAVAQGWQAVTDALAPPVPPTLQALHGAWSAVDQWLQPWVGELQYHLGQLSQWCSMQWQRLVQAFASVRHVPQFNMSRHDARRALYAPSSLAPTPSRAS